MARVLKGSQLFLHTPHSSANGMNHTCLCLPTKLVLIYRPRRDERLSCVQEGKCIPTELKYVANLLSLRVYSYTHYASKHVTFRRKKSEIFLGRGICLFPKIFLSFFRSPFSIPNLKIKLHLLVHPRSKNSGYIYVRNYIGFPDIYSSLLASNA